MMFRKAIVAGTLAFVLMAAPAGLGTYNNIVSAVPTVTAKAISADIHIQLSGVPLKLSTPAVFLNRTTFVPLREVAEALGAKVTWHAGSTQQQRITITRGERSTTLTLGATTLTANGRTIKLAAAPLIIGKSTMVPLRAISEALGTVVAWDGINRIVHINEPTELPVIGTNEKLEQLLSQIEHHSMAIHDNATVTVTTESMEASTTDKFAAAAPEAPASADNSGDSYSQTNVQVQGVDEADWAKTDGNYVYQLSSSRLFITDISKPAAPQLAATLEYAPEEGFYPQELYVDKGQFIVIGQKQDAPIAIQAPDSKMGITRPQIIRNTVHTKIYDWDAAAGKPKLIRETELEGNYISSRKVESSLYVLTNTYKGHNDFEPMYGDSASSSSSALKKLPLSDIRYFPESPDYSTLLIGSLDLEKPAQEMQVSAYLGSGQTIYASTKHLYVAIAKYLPNTKGTGYRQETQVYKFRLDQGKIVYIGEGSVPGTILNQFAMDEHEGYFRIATTAGDMWASGNAASSNNLYVLDEQMKTIGALEKLAPGERIYSTRFMGSRAYMVTFRNVDPLFAIDLRNPVKPAVLGQLKIPGYSDYLHPYDENHLIGFGKETVEVPSKGMGPDATMAFYQGMKIALFDVSDVSHPKEKFKQIIGDRGTSSELLTNHKALLFSKAKGLMAFPVELMEIQDKESLIQDGGFPGYGQFTYQGAYVYHIDLKEGFKLRGRITHLTQEDLSKSGVYGFDYSKAVRRILYAGNTLYTLSDRMLKANDLNNLKEQGQLPYPPAPEQQYKIYSR